MGLYKIKRSGRKELIQYSDNSYSNLTTRKNLLIQEQKKNQKISDPGRESVLFQKHFFTKPGVLSYVDIKKIVINNVIIFQVE